MAARRTGDRGPRRNELRDDCVERWMYRGADRSASFGPVRNTVDLGESIELGSARFERPRSAATDAMSDWRLSAFGIFTKTDRSRNASL